LRPALTASIAAGRRIAYVATHKNNEEAPMPDKPYEVPAEMRDLAEKSVEQARKAFDGFLGAASKAVDTLHNSQTMAQGNVADLAHKAFGYANENVTAAFDLAQKLVQAKNVQEVMALQSAFMQQQMAAFQNRMTELGGHSGAGEDGSPKPKKG
jgi:phasin